MTSSVALYLNPEAYDTSVHQLMGRHSAGESFLKGYLEHARTDRFLFWNVANRPLPELEAFVDRFGLRGRSVTWIGARERHRLREAGCVHLPSPQVAREAWARNVIGHDNNYGVTAITHTTATHGIMDAMANLLVAPCQPWDALICTSRALRTSVETQLEAVGDHFRAKLGASGAFAPPQIVTIPLGIQTAAFRHDPEARRRLREENGIPPDALVVLYVGRFSLNAKMNTGPMAIALERAAQRTGRPIHWVLSGWSHDAGRHEAFREATEAFCPSVTVTFLDGRKPENRFAAWSVGDIFISLSDNVQETFGLTPVEAMAAGLPSVISDWNGYKDTVRHDMDGFRIPTYTPRAGSGRDIAYRHAYETESYEAYVGGAAQFVAVDVEEAALALSRLIENPDLRRQMGASAQARAVEVFDWRNIIPHYEALWADSHARRRAASAPTPGVRNHTDNPWRMDPFRLFASYPTEWITPSSMVALSPGMTPELAAQALSQPQVRYASPLLPTMQESGKLVQALNRVPQVMVHRLLDGFPPNRRMFIERGLVWLAKYGVVQIFSRNAAPPGESQ